MFKRVASFISLWSSVYYYYCLYRFLSQRLIPDVMPPLYYATSSPCPKMDPLECAGWRALKWWVYALLNMNHAWVHWALKPVAKDFKVYLLGFCIKRHMICSNAAWKWSSISFGNLSKTLIRDKKLGSCRNCLYRSWTDSWILVCMVLRKHHHMNKHIVRLVPCPECINRWGT